MKSIKIQTKIKHIGAFVKRSLPILLLIIFTLGLATTCFNFIHKPVASQIVKAPAPDPIPSIIPSQFDTLPNWNKKKHAQSLRTFQKSCQVMLKSNPSQSIGAKQLSLHIQDFHKVCQEALKLPQTTDDYQARQFFEKHFTPYRWSHVEKGLFTGYYSPTFPGRPQKTNAYRYPIYGLPTNLVMIKLSDFSKDFPNKTLYGKLDQHRIKPYDRRADINKGSIKPYAPVLAWLKDPMDALELEIQGAGIIEMPNKTFVLNYAAQNGQPYQAIGKFLIADGKIEKKDMSMFAIRDYFAHHPEQVNHYFNQNPSYVFFKPVTKTLFYGAQNVPLTPGYSLAIDHQYIPLGMPIYVSTELPNQNRLERLMIAQDIGGAIKGPIRGDIYWGKHPHAKQMASLMQHQGTFWMLIPHH